MLIGSIQLIKYDHKQGIMFGRHAWSQYKGLTNWIDKLFAEIINTEIATFKYCPFERGTF